MSKWDYLDELYEDFEQVERIKKSDSIETSYVPVPKKKGFKAARNMQRKHKERHRD